MVKVGNFNLNITPELQELLRQNPPKTVKKAVIEKRKDDFERPIQAKDGEGNNKFANAVIDIYPFVYFDASGRYYLNAFRTKEVEFQGKDVEVIVTNPNIKTDKNCTMYGKGIPSHRQPIPGSELWDNGRSDLNPHTELICKGDPLTEIVKIMTRDEVLKVDLKPSGIGIVAQIANLSGEEK